MLKISVDSSFANLRAKQVFYILVLPFTCVCEIELNGYQCLPGFIFQIKKNVVEVFIMTIEIIAVFAWIAFRF